MNMASTTVPSQQARSLTRKPIALAIAASLIGVASLTSCSPSAPNADASTPTVTKATDVQIAPAPPAKPRPGRFPAKPVSALPMSLILKGNTRIAPKIPLAACGSPSRRGF